MGNGTSIGKVRGLGSAHGGSHHWLLQRFTAVGNLLLILWLIASLLMGRRVTDLHSGMRAYRKSLLDELKYQVNGAALPVELLLRPLKMGKRLKVVFIAYRERIGQTTMRPLQSAWWTLRRILAVRFS